MYLDGTSSILKKTQIEVASLLGQLLKPRAGGSTGTGSSTVGRPKRGRRKDAEDHNGNEDFGRDHMSGNMFLKQNPCGDGMYLI